MNKIERGVIQVAINIIQDYLKDLSINVNLVESNSPNNDGELIVMHKNHRDVIYYINAKRNITTLEQVNKLQGVIGADTLLICEGLTKAIYERLIQKKIQFIDTAGNIYLENENFLIYSVGKKILKGKSKSNQGRAFSKTGLKTIFQFLLEPDLVNNNYRAISEVLDVSLGSLKWIFYHLRNEQLIISESRGERSLNNRKELMNKWILAFKEKLRPSLVVGRYRFAKKLDKKNRQHVLDDIEETYWGAEAAAAILDGYLKPEFYTIYSSKSEIELMKSLKLIPDENGNVEILSTFWNQSYFNHYQSDNLKIVPTILIYADLINSGISRNLEAAELLRIKNEL